MIVDPRTAFPVVIATAVLLLGGCADSGYRPGQGLPPESESSAPLDSEGYDRAARTDASTLGKEMATYFVDNLEMPQIVVDQGTYILIAPNGNQSPLGTVSEGVELRGLMGTKSTDWCVWVEAPQGDVKQFSFSAARGSQDGAC